MSSKGHDSEPTATPPATQRAQSRTAPEHILSEEQSILIPKSVANGEGAFHQDSGDQTPVCWSTGSFRPVPVLTARAHDLDPCQICFAHATRGNTHTGSAPHRPESETEMASTEGPDPSASHSETADETATVHCDFCGTALAARAYPNHLAYECAETE